MDEFNRPRILVINPNSNVSVTANMDYALQPLKLKDGPEIVCTTLAEGPFGIESQADVESVALPLRRLIEADNQSDAFVIACYSDPGIHVCREGTPRPVFGIAESAVLTALARGERFGVIAIKSRSIPRHIRYLRQMGLTERLAGERALEMSVADSGGDKALERMIAVGAALRDEGWRQCRHHGLRRHGAAQETARAGARSAGDRSDPGSSDPCLRGTRLRVTDERPLVVHAGGSTTPVCAVINP